jgi:hypothetical protein
VTRKDLVSFSNAEKRAGWFCKSDLWWATAYNSKNFHAYLCFDFLDLIVRDCVKVKMTEIFGLKPEYKERLNSYALKRFNDWQERILSKASQVRQLSIEQLNADLDTYLHDNEKVEFSKCVADIAGWLSKCMDTGDRYFPDAYATWVITPMFRVESLIMKAYQAKEDEKEWNAACKAVNPPLSDAKMYFGNEEYDEFIGAARQAILVYTEKGEDYLSDVRSLDYCRYLERIRNRKEKERQLLLAKLAAEEFNRRLNEEKVRLQALLFPYRKAIESYFRKQVKDRRYTGQDFSRLLSRKEVQDFDNIPVGISRNKAEELVSNDFRPFIASECWRSFFLLPSADYILEEVPCLGFIFDVFAVVETGVWLKPGQKKFNGYVFDFPWRKEKERSSVKTQEFLGYHYFVLTPEELGGWSFWQTIPLVLLKGLLSGETRPSGTVIVSASDDDVTYRVEGFAEEVEIPTQFAEYLERSGSFDEMVGMGIMTKKVGNIVKAALGELEVKRKIPPAREKGRRRDSVKERAFHLFDEDKRPGDAEVKSLGIKPNTAYRYYQEWKKTQNHT